MKKVAIILAILLFLTIIQTNTFVNADEASPEIRDDDYGEPISGDADLDDEPLVQQANIDSAWFGSETINSFETTLKVKRIDIIPIDLGFGGSLRNIKQLTVNYYVFFKSTADNTNYYTLATVKTEIDLQNYQNILPHYEFSIGRGDSPNNTLMITNTSGTIDKARSTVSVLVPKNIIGNPQKGDRLNQTYAITTLEIGGFGLIDLNLLNVRRDRAGYLADDNFGLDYVFRESAIKGTIRLEIEGTNSQDVLPGGTAIYNFILTNTGNEKKDVSMNYRGNLLSGWSAEFDNSIVTVEAGRTAKVKLTVKTSSNAQDGESVSLTVDGNYTEGGKTIDTIDKITVHTTIKIQQDYGVSLSSSKTSEKCNPGKYINFSLTVKNTGTKEDTITIDNPEKEGDLDVEIDKTEVKLAKGKTETIIVKVIVSESAKEGKFNITIRATSKGDATKTAEKKLTIEITTAGNYGTPITEEEERPFFDMNKIISLLLLALIVAIVIVAYAVWRKGQRKRIIEEKPEEFKEVKKK